MLSSVRTVRWMLSGAGYLCRTAGYLYTRPGWFQPHVLASSLPLCARCHRPFWHSLHALYAARAGHVLPHLPARYAHPHSHPAAPPWFFLGAYRWLSLSTVGGPHPFRACKCVTVTCAHESILFPHLERQGGNRPSCAERCRAPRTNPAARAAGGEPPPLKAPRALRAPRKCRSSSGPGGHTPLSQPHRCGTVLGIRRSMSCWGQLLAPPSCRTHCRRAHTLTWACQCGTPVHLFHARLYLP